MKKYVLALAILCQASWSAADRPNILLILCDDVGTGDLRAYNNRVTNPDGILPPELPTLSRLAEQGMTFLDANTPAALCAPNRYSLMTGNYVWRGRDPSGSWHFNRGSQILAGQLTLASLLQKRGYHTAMFGKSHLGGRVWPKNPLPEGEQDYTKITNWDEGRPAGNKQAGDEKAFDYFNADFTRPLPDGVNDHGFDYSFISQGGIQDSPYMWFENGLPYGVEDPADPQKSFVFHPGGRTENANGVAEIWGWQAGYGVPSWKSNEVGIEMTKKALDFIDRHHEENQRDQQDRPFFIHFCTEAVHQPHTPPLSFMGVPVAGQTESAHGDMLLQIDLMVSQLEQKLLAKGLLENTLIIFTSDNGGLRPRESRSKHLSNYGLRENKALIWEGGHRIPLIMKWGDGTAGGSKISPASRAPQFVALQDIYPTLAEIVGLEVPDGQAVDSIGFSELVLAENPAGLPARRHEQAMTGIMDVDFPNEKYQSHKALRSNGWKLVTDNNYEPVFLCNLKVDPMEQVNLLDNPEHAGRVAAMIERLREEMATE